MAPKRQAEPSLDARRVLMEQHKDHDEEQTGVRPDLVLDTTEDDADWIRDPRFWRAPDAPEPET